MKRTALGMVVWSAGWMLACAGSSPAPDAGASPAAPPEAPAASAPVLGALQATEQFEGAGCSCVAPSGTGSSYLSDGDKQAMHIDGADRELTQVEAEDKAKAKVRIERYTSGAYAVDMRWKEVSQGEGGASYDVKVRVTNGDGPALETTLSCGCGC